MADIPEVLFVCTHNAGRSQMAAAMLHHQASGRVRVTSAGSRPASELNPAVVHAMAEIGIDISRHKPVTFEELDEWEGLNFDLIITLAPEAHHRAMELTRTSGVEVEYWPTADATAVDGNREQRLDAYRQVRDHLMARIRQRFAGPRTGNE